MKTRMWGTTAAFVGCLVCVAAVGEDFLHARVSYDAGTSMVKGRDDADWSYATINTIVLPGDTLWADKEGTTELEMSGGSFLRMADGSKADIETLPPSGRIRGWNGSFYIQRTGRSTGSMEFVTPVCMVDVDQNGMVRIDIGADGATTVSVRWGHATVRCEAGGDVSLNAGKRSYVDPGYLPSEPAAFDANVEDDFDTWNRDRSRLLAEGAQRIPPAVHIDKAPIGVADLSPYGEWVQWDSAYYWRPTVVVDYVPYRQGRWSYVSGAGYCWVGGYPFSYVTTHYGRWRYSDHYGWVWTYRDTWSPAWVHAVHYGPNFVWTPLDPFDRPCVAFGDTFAVGRSHFGIYASSYCLADDLLMGTCYVRPVTSFVVRPVPLAQITVWNINIGSHHSRHRDFARDSHLEVRDYAPRRVIRGFDALPSRESARNRVATLETSYGRNEFAAHRGDQPRQRATSDRQGRDARIRSVRVAPDIRESAADPRRSAVLMNAPTTPEGRGKTPFSGTAETPRASRGEKPDTERGGRQGRDGIRTLEKPDRTQTPDRITTRSDRSGGRAGGDAGQAPAPDRSVMRSRGADSARSPSEGLRTPARPGQTPDPGRDTIRRDRSGGPAAPAPAPERTTVRSRSRETVPAPVPMRGPEPAPSRRDTARPAPDLRPEPTSPRVRIDRSQGADSGGFTPRLEGTRSRGPAASEPTRVTEPVRREVNRQPSTTPTLGQGMQTRGVESGGRERGRDVQVQRLAPPQSPIAEPRQEGNRVPQMNVAPRVDPRQQVAPAPQPRQEPAHPSAPLGRGNGSEHRRR